MASIVATRVNPLIKATYGRIGSKGYQKKKALAAVMVKMLLVLNHMAKTGEVWRG